MRLPRLSANGWLLVGFGLILAALIGEPAYRSITGIKSAEEVRMEQQEALAAKLAAGPRVGDPAPDFTLPTLAKGNKVNLHDFRGRPVLISFYCGCYLCRGVAKELEKLEKAPLKHRPVVLGLASFSQDRLVPFIHDTGAKHTLYLHDEGKHVGRQWGSTVCPRVWVVDESGKIAFRHEEPEGSMQPSPVPAEVKAVLERPQLLQTAAR